MWGAGGCPFVMKTDLPESGITGTLIHVEETIYNKTQKQLDSLEGYRGPGLNNWYERRLITVQSKSGPVKAWIYVVEGETAQRVREQYQLITHGDWIKHKTAALA